MRRRQISEISPEDILYQVESNLPSQKEIANIKVGIGATVDFLNKGNWTLLANEINEYIPNAQVSPEHFLGGRLAYSQEQRDSFEQQFGLPSTNLKLYLHPDQYEDFCRSLNRYNRYDDFTQTTEFYCPTQVQFPASDFMESILPGLNLSGLEVSKIPPRQGPVNKFLISSILDTYNPNRESIGNLVRENIGNIDSQFSLLHLSYETMTSILNDIIVGKENTSIIQNEETTEFNIRQFVFANVIPSLSYYARKKRNISRQEANDITSELAFDFNLIPDHVTSTLQFNEVIKSASRLKKVFGTRMLTPIILGLGPSEENIEMYQNLPNPYQQLSSSCPYNNSLNSGIPFPVEGLIAIDRLVASDSHFVTELEKLVESKLPSSSSSKAYKSAI